MSAKDVRHWIDPADWLVEWSRSTSRAAEAVTTEAVTPWFSGATNPLLTGWYERMFTDGLLRQWWDGLHWYSITGSKPHWRQVGDYPCWRGLLAPAVDRDFAAFRVYSASTPLARDTTSNAFHAGIAYGRKNPR